MLMCFWLFPDALLLNDSVGTDHQLCAWDCFRREEVLHMRIGVQNLEVLFNFFSSDLPIVRQRLSEKFSQI